MTRTIDLNCDLGESPHAPELDRELLEFATSANIACGAHAGDEGTMRAAVLAALARGRGKVAIGAHPSYPDRASFGRAEMAMEPRVLGDWVAAQVGLLVRVARECGARVAHVKPHGALYHAAMRRPEVAEAVGRAVLGVDPTLAMVGPCGGAGGPGLGVWRGLGLTVIEEAFADRRYEPDGALRARAKAGAVLGSPQAAAEQAVRIALGRGALAEDGTVVPFAADTLCVHSDTPGAPAVARAVRAALERAGVVVERPGA